MNHIINKKITEGEAELRLDEAAAVIFDITKSQANKFIKNGEIRLNGQWNKPKSRVSLGDTVSLEKKIDEVPKIPIIFQDKDIIVVEKPAGITTHPAKSESKITLIEALEQERKLYLVHRLDKGTSGLILFAKNKETQEYLRQKFLAREVKKKYLALVWGHIYPEEGSIVMPVSRDRGKITPSSEGKDAESEYRVLRYYKDYSYLKLSPKSGRTHQLRVHLSSIGYPIVGDMKYGKKVNVLERLFLHSSEITFKSISGKQVSYQSTLPKELNSFLQNLE